jgi:hypothetical protein
MLRALFRLVFAALIPAAAAAQSAPFGPSQIGADPLHDSGKNVTISILTMGVGENIWELFGHDAIWLHDDVSGRDTVFNWGVFSFAQPHFIARFLKGTMLYAMGGDSMGGIMYEYHYWNRSVLSQELDLTSAEKDSVLHIIQQNALPENINYRYDYYRDNCSTRVRDIIDRALGGQLRAQAQGLTGTTYRWHTLRLMQSGVPVEIGVDIGLGEPGDRDLTKWQTMFLPRQLHDFIASVQVRDSAGAMHPLVRNERVLFRANRPPEPAAPPHMLLWLLPIGLILCALFVWLAEVGHRGSRIAQIAAAMLFCVWSLVAGFLGLLLTALWTVTDHVFAHSNENLLLFNPLWLVLAVLVVVFFWTHRAQRWTQMFAYGLAALSVIALLAHVVGISRQVNGAVIALALPPALAIAWAVFRANPAASA